MLYMLLILVSFSSFAIRSEAFVYQLKGNYLLNKKNVNYVLRWSEDGNDIHGVYKDDLLKNEKEVKGEIRNNSRVFVIPQNIVIKTKKEEVRRFGHEIPTTISLIEGDKVQEEKLKGSFSATAAIVQKQEEEGCVTGFGALASYCGIYEGLVTKEIDRQGHCDLLSNKNLELQIRPDRNVRFYLGSFKELESASYHEIGMLPLNANSSRIDINKRVCRPLAGVMPMSSKCKRLDLEGEFTTVGGKQSFQGTYQIFDESTMNTCTYSLSLSRIEKK